MTTSAHHPTGRDADDGAVRVPVGPPGLGLELSADATLSGDGWLERVLVAAPGLDGPPGILQGGLVAGVVGAVARQADRFGAPLTSVDARLHAPTPLGRPLRARVRAGDGPARYVVELRDGDALLVSGTVELAGHEVGPRPYDLLELAEVPLPGPEPQYAYPTCFVCGPEPTHPLALRLHPRPYGPETMVQPWIAEDAHGDDAGVVDPTLVAAVLDCPTVWAAMGRLHAAGHRGALLAGYRLQAYRDAPVMEPLRIVARLDDIDGRKVRARGALVDEDGLLYAMVSVLHVAVAEIPDLTGG